jgi:glycosyltransferase involved in cell wall biosynthesis
MLPKITIISVVLNSASDLEKTILNIAGLDYPEKEFIVVDGGSTDSTPDIIKKYSHLINLSLCIPNSSIYDSMNYAIPHATGEWVNFMNSGDCFADSSILRNIFENMNGYSNNVILYGNTLIDYGKGGSRILRANTARPLWKQYINHQSTFYRKSYLTEMHFDTHYQLCADFELLIKAHFSGKPMEYLPYIISVRKGGGVSDVNRVKAWKEKNRVLAQYISPVKANEYCRKKIVLENMKYFCKHLIPSLLQKQIRKLL